jgi:hypothetical protein
MSKLVNCKGKELKVKDTFIFDDEIWEVRKIFEPTARRPIGFVEICHLGEPYTLAAENVGLRFIP